MSYIYEALLRAERERERKQQPFAPADQEAMPVLGEAPVTAPHELPLPTAGELPLELPPEEEFAGIAAVPLFSWNIVRASFPALEKRGRGLEQFRGLRSHLYQARKEMPLKTLLVSSGMPSEGKSFVTANLAMSLARNNNNRILLIDGDLRRPSLNFLLGAPNEIGLADYLSGREPLHAVMQRCEPAADSGSGEAPSLANLTFIPTGTQHENASELINSRRVEALLTSAASSFDWILIDTPPALVFADAVDLARVADGVILVARGAQTTFEVAQRAQASFANAHILGIVLNDIKNPPRRESYYDYYYYGKKDKKTAAEAENAQQEAE